MNETLTYIKKKYNLSFDKPLPIVLSPFHRSYEVVELFNELGFKTGVEIGTSKGWYAKRLCQGVPGLKLFSIDPWKIYNDYHEIKDQVVFDELYRQAKKKLAGFNCELIRKTSREAVKDFKPDSLDFAFIDGNHDFEYVVEDIAAWSKIVRPGGIIFGHDYIEGVDTEDTSEVANAVLAYTKAKRIWPWFILRARRTSDCWMWVKQ